MTPEKI